ncbi:hypothetical protein M3Y99_01294100 [Aphelenchoides fujianensis]|nr:hypothetical protein M3Y99_01294100 [Aphelenchoides fujianensis]
MTENDAKDTLFASDLLVHIGSAEIESVLPTASEYTRQLYDQIRDKELKLGKMKQEVETLSAENEEKERTINSMTEERDALRNALEEGKKKVDERNSSLSIAHKQTSSRLQGAGIAKQQDYYEDLSRKLHERTMRRQSVDAKLQLAESSRQQMDESLKRDAKTIRELEIYLSKITKQIYERQREIDELKLGQLDKKAEAEGLRRMLRDIEGKQEKIKDKYMKQLAVRDRILETYKTERGAPSDEEIETQRLKRRVQEEEQQVQFTNNKILDKQLKLAEINAENNVLRNRIERFKVLSSGLQSGDSLAMYEGRQIHSSNRLIRFLQAYIIGAPEVEGTEKIGENDGLESILKKKELKLAEIKLNLAKVKAEVDAKRALLQSEKNAASDGEQTEEMPSARSGVRSSRSVPDLNARDSGAPKGQLARLDKKRKEIIANEEKNAISDLTQRKKKLADEHENQKAANLKTALKQMAENYERQEREAREKAEVVRKEKETRMNALYQQLVEADVQLFNEEKQKNALIESLRQAEVDEDNLRNRFLTYKGLRQTQKANHKQLEQTQQVVEEWRARVDQSRSELDELRNMLALSVKRNKPTREQLATLKPYYDEVAESEALMERKKQLEEQWKRLQRKKVAKDAESSGEITIL